MKTYINPSMKYVSLNMGSTLLAASSVYTHGDNTTSTSNLTTGIETSTGYLDGSAEQTFNW